MVLPPLATGYLYAELEVSAMVWGLPPWYDPLEETGGEGGGSLVHSPFLIASIYSTKCNRLGRTKHTSSARLVSLL